VFEAAKSVRPADVDVILAGTAITRKKLVSTMRKGRLVSFRILPLRLWSAARHCRLDEVCVWTKRGS
jgi:hypothetical protein